MPHRRSRQAPRLDPRKPLLLGTHELNRRPGSQRLLRLRAPAPADLGTAMIGVPEGAQLDLDLRLESVMEGVLVTAQVRAPLAGECGRCLEQVSSNIEVSLQELYAYPESEAAADEAERLEGDILDLEPVLRDAVVLALPLVPLCRADCAGLCPRCGVRRDDADCGHDEEPVDPRWAALGQLRGRPVDAAGERE